MKRNRQEEKIQSLLNQIPVGVPINELVYNYIVVVLKRLNGNRTWSASDLGISLRTLRVKLSEMRVFKYEVEPPKTGLSKKK